MYCIYVCVVSDCVILFRFDASKDPDWFCQNAFAQPNQRRIVVEVGGKVLEQSVYMALCAQKEWLRSLK